MVRKRNLDYRGKADYDPTLFVLQNISGAGLFLSMGFPLMQMMRGRSDPFKADREVIIKRHVREKYGSGKVIISRYREDGKYRVYDVFLSGEPIQVRTSRRGMKVFDSHALRLEEALTE